MIDKEFKAIYACRKFWNDAYLRGTRVTFADEIFHFHGSTPPSVRLAAAGNRYGVFPDLVEVDPDPWVLDGIERHKLHLLAWLSQAWPQALQKFAYHILVTEHELQPLMHYAASIGEQVGGRVADGGSIPIYCGKKAKSVEYVQRSLPPILRECGWTEISFAESAPKSVNQPRKEKEECVPIAKAKMLTAISDAAPATRAGKSGRFRARLLRMTGDQLAARAKVRMAMTHLRDLIEFKSGDTGRFARMVDGKGGSLGDFGKWVGFVRKACADDQVILHHPKAATWIMRKLDWIVG